VHFAGKLEIDHNAATVKIIYKDMSGEDIHIWNTLDFPHSFSAAINLYLSRFIITGDTNLLITDAINRRFIQSMSNSTVNITQ
jgi:hypothetical protein